MIGLPVPRSPIDLWLRKELAEHLRLPDGGWRVEVIDGDIYVTSRPELRYEAIVRSIEEAVAASGSLSSVRGDESPALVVTPVADAAAAPQDGVPTSLTVDVLSPAFFREHNREVEERHRAGPRASSPFRLVVDAAPEACRATLFGPPHAADGGYAAVASWEFGDPVVLPQPFGVTIDTTAWYPLE
ncbi:hypothetical protein [Streptodolium elevatio]